MRLFRKKEKPLSEGQERFAMRIAERILVMQRRLADWLNLRTAGLHPRVWLMLLVLFCAGFGGYLIRLIMQVFD